MNTWKNIICPLYVDHIHERYNEADQGLLTLDHKIVRTSTLIGGAAFENNVRWETECNKNENHNGNKNEMVIL